MTIPCPNVAKICLLTDLSRTFSRWNVASSLCVSRSCSFLQLFQNDCRIRWFCYGLTWTQRSTQKTRRTITIGNHCSEVQSASQLPRIDDLLVQHDNSASLIYVALHPSSMQNLMALAALGIVSALPPVLTLMQVENFVKSPIARQWDCVIGLISQV